MASHAHSPRARALARVTAARGIALETATALCRGDITSESYVSSARAHGVHLRQSGVTDLIKAFHIRIITLIKI